MWSESDSVLADLPRLHGCPPGCERCAHADAQYGVPDLLADQKEFVRSRDALRVTLLSKRSGRPFPVVSPDEVVQFCVEEACYERLHLSEQLAQRRRVDEVEAGSAKSAAHASALESAREFARTGVTPS